jgi:hypothetical protein
VHSRELAQQATLGRRRGAGPDLCGGGASGHSGGVVVGGWVGGGREGFPDFMVVCRPRTQAGPRGSTGVDVEIRGFRPGSNITL